MISRHKSIRLMSDDLNNPDRIERKQIETICDGCSKLIQQCSKKELKVVDLKWQPHYSTVFKQLKSQLESILSTDTSKTLEKLNTIPYLLALKNNIFSLLNYFSKFVIDNSSFIGNKNHHSRKTFFVKIVHFQFLCHEIQAYFPKGVYSPSKVNISKLPARTWWQQIFGEISFVDLDTFVNKFKEDYPFINQAEIFSFKGSINFTSTNFITTFEFDLFTRLYSPWEIVQEAWRMINSHPGYLHFSTYGDTKDILSKHLDKPGTYVFRVSCKDLGFWTIGYVKGGKEMGQIKVDKTNLIEALVEGQKKNLYLYPNGGSTNPDLSNINQYRKEIIVKNEDLQLYDCFEDFKECKICRESEKDLQLESCGHQICHFCYKMLRKYDKRLCPFCNQKISSTTKIINVTNPYMEHNPGPKESGVPNDFLYADMTLDSKNIPDSDGDGSVQIRMSSIQKPPTQSVNSNNVEDPIPFDLPVCAAPLAPTRPVKDRCYNFKMEDAKPTIIYPPMQNIKDNSRGDTTLKKENCSSPLYLEMISNHANNKNNVNEVDELYCDVTNHLVLNNIENNSTSLYNNGEVTNNNSQAFHLHNGHMTFPNSMSYKDDIYCEPNEISCTNMAFNNSDKSSIINSKIHNELYMLPIENDLSVKDSVTIVAGSLYCVLPEESANGVDTSAQEDELLSKWSKKDISRALRVARNDRLLARDILMEFVAAK